MKTKYNNGLPTKDRLRRPKRDNTTFVPTSCRQGDLVRVKELLLHNNPTDGSQTLGLRDAATNNHIEVMRFLLENYVIIDRTTL